MKLSNLTPTQQIAILKHVADLQHRRILELAMEVEHLQSNGKVDAYGTTVLTDQDRLLNRIHLAWVISELGIPDHDTETLAWITQFLDANGDTADETLVARGDTVSPQEKEES